MITRGMGRGQRMVTRGMGPRVAAIPEIKIIPFLTFYKAEKVRRFQHARI